MNQKAEQGAQSQTNLDNHPPPSIDSARTRANKLDTKFKRQKSSKARSALAFLTKFISIKWDALGAYRFVVLGSSLLLLVAIVTLTDRLLWRSHLESWHYRAQMSRMISQGLSHINKDWSVEIMTSRSVGYLAVYMPIIKFFNQGKLVFIAKATGNLDLLPNIFFGYGLITLKGTVDDGGAFNLVHRMNLRELWNVLSDFTLPVPELLKISIRNIPETVLWGLWPSLKTSPRLRITDIKLSGFGSFQRGEGPFRMDLRPGMVQLKAMGGTLTLKVRAKPIKIECRNQQCELLNSISISPDIGKITLRKGIFFWDHKIKGNDLMLNGQWKPANDQAAMVFANILGCDQPIKTKTWSISGDLSSPNCTP